MKTNLTAWGRYPVIEADCQRPEKIVTVNHLIQENNNLLARGLGRSYGDASLNAEGITVLMQRLNRILAFDADTGILECEAGVSLKEIAEIFVPRGWFIGVTPGTKFVTIGGAIAFDVHGKNHHQDGSFGSFVMNFHLLTATGQTVHCSRTENSDLFWATLGGMGLTGVIISAQLQLISIPTAYINNHNFKAKNLDEAIAIFAEHEPNYRYSVAWIDCLARGNNLGRSIVMFGNHAEIKDLPTEKQKNCLQIPAKKRFTVSFDLPSGLLNRYTMSIFNSLFYAKTLSKETKVITDYDSFFYPLDFLWDWNRMYGKKGFIQYQCVFPTEASREALTKVLTLCGDQGWGSFLAVLKRFGNQEGLLSFPSKGYTLTLDMPVKQGLWEFLDLLDQLVLDYGGRVYLAKDARLNGVNFRKMYPKFEQWLEIKKQIDPENHFTSMMAKRLEILY